MSSGRRRLLKGATAGAALTLPTLARAQSPIVLRFQSTWPANDLLHEFALDFASRVNDMTGGDLRIEMFSARAVVPAADLLEAVSKGALDGGHGQVSHHFGRHPAFALWGTGPAFGMDANMLLAWHKYGGGRELLRQLHDAVGANVVSFPYGPMPTPPLGWFHKPITRPEDFKGLVFRTSGLAADIYAALGATVRELPTPEVAAAMASGLLQGAEHQNISSDRLLGLAEVAKVCMLQSYHRSAAPLEILFNKAKYDALPPRIRTIIENAVEAASADVAWKAVGRLSRDHAALQDGKEVRLLRTPDSVLRRQLAAFDAAAKKREDVALFGRVLESQRLFAKRAVRWQLETQIGPRVAYGHYFGGQPAPRPPGKKR
jgi:TRAP-type mannitol/chloroaromatic compound transport system substrate-binding protein